VYVRAIGQLAQDLDKVDLQSRGLQACRQMLRTYTASPEFQRLRDEAEQLKQDLSAVRYCVLIKDTTVKVRPYDGEADYSLEVEKTFEKFKQGAVKDYSVKLNIVSSMNHVEAQILDLVARLYPDLFARLHRFCADHAQFAADFILTFDREIQFYLAYLETILPLMKGGLKFCLPAVSSQSKEVMTSESFDLALAIQLRSETARIVPNDFQLSGNERIIIVSGPNQGGKTTFARMFGQLHHLACLGLPVPGREARLFCFDHIFTHFEREEDIRKLRGKLNEELTRMRQIFDQATPNSLLILNEPFNSTTLKDALFLSQKMMRWILERDQLGVWVTFLTELASASEKTVSMVSTVDAEDTSRRTFRIVRREADGLAFAMTIAEKHRLTYRQLKERIAP
ncbi:MAG: MutS-related protein, partial [Bellilinea sp.]